MAETEPVRPESPAFYRAKAQEIFQQAERATTEEARAEETLRRSEAGLLCSKAATIQGKPVCSAICLWLL